MKNEQIQKAVMAGLGGAVGIFLLALISERGGSLLLMAPFGASCVLLFSVPASPLSQPLNVVGGHLVSSAIGVALALFVPPTPLALGTAHQTVAQHILLTDDHQAADFETALDCQNARRSFPGLELCQFREIVDPADPLEPVLFGHLQETVKRSFISNIRSARSCRFSI